MYECVPLLLLLVVVEMPVIRFGGTSSARPSALALSPDCNSTLCPTGRLLAGAPGRLPAAPRGRKGIERKAALPAGWNAGGRLSRERTAATLESEAAESQPNPSRGFGLCRSGAPKDALGKSEPLLGALQVVIRP